ncbi:hypothetical protein LOC68_09915 [Blastopirellula sp. JC732]|uniref:DUF1850 domain-containing protein n=1 Tax=Blastopirellula sediminis TaxID=2894196 RepID=A0A9X1MNH6_9BACT|nr:hypothetical protein [Blastopirellula sediminis]MCC9608509.1 hypothetical protein [Blastopirellula sediminis]MCC9628714.1 hypothetical protein [Blastopirellula sediminis]
MSESLSSESKQAKRRRIIKTTIVASLLLAAGLLAIGFVIGYRLATVFPPSEVSIIGVETTPTERIVYLQEDANTFYWSESVSIWGEPNPWVTLHRRWYFSRHFASDEYGDGDRFSVPLDCERFTLLGAWGDTYTIEMADLPEIASEDAPPSRRELKFQDAMQEY